MAIHSNAFGSVVLTDEDAAKFQRQVTFGRPKQAARQSVARGVEMSKEYQRTGKLVLKAR